MRTDRTDRGGPRRDRGRGRFGLPLVGLLAAGLLACASGPDSGEGGRAGAAASAGADAEPDLGRFDASAAADHLEALQGSRRARYVLRQLGGAAGAGASPKGEPGPRALATLAGDSPDVLLLVASLDGPTGTGAAVLLELARALGERERAFTTVLAFVVGDGADEGEEAGLESGLEPGVDAHPGSRALLEALQAAGLFERVRLAVFFDDFPEDAPGAARDVRSNRVYREEFWRAAAELGLADVFPSGAPLESPRSGHLVFLEAGLRQVVVITPAEPLGARSRGRPPEQTVAGLGAVSIEALTRISERLRRIDRFREAPLEDPLPVGPRLADEPGAHSEPEPSPRPRPLQGEARGEVLEGPAAP